MSDSGSASDYSDVAGRVHVGSPRSSKRTKLTSYLNPPITNAPASGPELAAHGLAHPTGRTRFVFRGRPLNPFQKRHVRVSERSRAPPTTNNRLFLGTELTPAKSRGHRVRVHARPLDLRPPVSPLVRRPPAFHFAFLVVWCRGQSHGRSGSRIAVSSRARGSGTAPCRSS